MVSATNKLTSTATPINAYNCSRSVASWPVVWSVWSIVACLAFLLVTNIPIDRTVTNAINACTYDGVTGTYFGRKFSSSRKNACDSDMGLDQCVYGTHNII